MPLGRHYQEHMSGLFLPHSFLPSPKGLAALFVVGLAFVCPVVLYGYAVMAFAVVWFLVVRRVVVRR